MFILQHYARPPDGNTKGTCRADSLQTIDLKVDPENSISGAYCIANESMPKNAFDKKLIRGESHSVKPRGNASKPMNRHIFSGIGPLQSKRLFPRRACGS
jgi:hypothetical protein